MCKVKLAMDPSIGTLIKECHLIRDKLKGKLRASMLARLVLRGEVWNLWKDWNARIFQQQARQKILVYRQLYEDL